MASLLIDGESVTVCLSAVEKLEALHGDVTVPRTAVAPREQSRPLRDMPAGTADQLAAPGSAPPAITHLQG
jgi:hypothetical protein